MRTADMIMIASAAFFAWACASTTLPEGASPASVSISDNDCAVLAAVSKEHYRFNADNPPPPLKGYGGPGWAPRCNWAVHGLVFSDYNDVPETAASSARLHWVEFAEPVYAGGGATVETSIMHGPLAGIGYVCHLRSGVAGWTVEQCDTAWVS